jgi:Outer membrane protein beta-barrel domain
MMRLVLILSLLILNPSVSIASGLNLGVLGGYSSLKADNEFGTSDGSIGYGVRAGLNFLRKLDLSAEYTKTSIGGSSNFTLLAASLDYSMWLHEPLRIFIGPKLGLGWVSANGDDGSNIEYGAELGFDYSFSPRISFGIEGNYLRTGSPTIGKFTGSSGYLIQALAAIKIWIY